MNRHWRTLRRTAVDCVLCVWVEVEAQPFARLAIAGATELDRELERFHERGRADHVVVVEGAPAGVGVLVAEQALRSQQGSVFGKALAVHQQVLPVHVDLDARDAAGAQRVDDVQRHADVSHEDLHRRLRVLVLEEEADPVLLAASGDLADAVEEPSPRLAIGSLERVVVALDPRPQDHLRSDRTGEVGCLQRLGKG